MKTVFKFFKGAFRSYRKEFAAALILALFSAAYGIFIPLAAKRFMELVSDNCNGRCSCRVQAFLLGYTCCKQA